LLEIAKVDRVDLLTPAVFAVPDVLAVQSAVADHQKCVVLLLRITGRVRVHSGLVGLERELIGVDHHHSRILVDCVFQVCFVQILNPVASSNLQNDKKMKRNMESLSTVP
jgi:hypothetical protein